MRQKFASFVFWSLLSGALLSAAGFESPKVAVGNRLQTQTNFKLTEPAPEGGLQVTLKVEDPARLKLSRRPDVAGTDSLTINIPAGLSESPDYWVHGFASSGEAAYTMKANGVPDGRGVVTLTPSAIVMVGPFKANRFKTTSGAAASRMVLYSVRLSPAGEYVEPQVVAGGLSLDIQISSSAPAIGELTPSSLQFPGGQANMVAEFKPAKVGSTTLAVNIPPGFSTPPANYANVVASVSLPGIALTDQVMVGQNLQVGGTVGLGELAGPNGVEVTITSDDPSQMILSPSATEVGKGSITLKIPANGYNAPFFIQALGKSGTVSYTATAKGFASRMAKIGLAPSGVVIAPKAYGPPDEAELFRKGKEGSRGFVAHLGKKAKVPLAVWMAQLDPITLRSADITVQALRAGLSVTVQVETTNPEVGSVISPVKIEGGHEMGSSEFVTKALGTATISVITPAGYTKSSNSTTVEAIVKE